MEEEKKIEQLVRKVDELSTRIDHIENRTKNRSNGNVWVLVPVVAIIMWGLQGIF